MTKIDFDKLDGLVPAVIQEIDTAVVLMVGFMNQAALDTTLATKQVTFWSRSRQALWTKGETSGNTLEVVDMRTDCDADTILVTVRVGGEGVCCHTGEKSCFFRELPV